MHEKRFRGNEKNIFFINKPNLSILVGINGLGSTFFLIIRKYFVNNAVLRKNGKS